MKDPKYLGWVDLETTGTNEREDHILEVAFALTDLVGTPKWAISYVISPPIDWADRMGETVREMHTKSGLVADVYGTTDTKIDVQEAIIGHLKQQGAKPHEVMLAGSGVGHFDKRFLQWQMYNLHQWFVYPVMDVGVIRRFLRFAGAGHLAPKLNESKTHRAMDDLNLHLSEYRHYVKLMWDYDLGDMATLLPEETISQEVTE